MITRRLFSVIRRNLLMLFLGIAVIVTGGALMNVSQHVHEKQKAVQNASRQIIEEGWAIRALKAEWAYLSRPDRLDELSMAMAQLQNNQLSQPARVAPVSFLSEKGEDLYIPAVLPMRKPAPRRIQRIQEVAHVAPVMKEPARQQEDFSSLLKQIGGTQ